MNVARSTTRVGGGGGGFETPELGAASKLKRTVALTLSVGECEALICLVSKHQPVWRVIAHDLAVDADEVETRMVEAHKAGLAVAAQIQPNT